MTLLGYPMNTQNEKSNQGITPFENSLANPIKTKNHDFHTLLKYCNDSKHGLKKPYLSKIIVWKKKTHPQQFTWIAPWLFFCCKQYIENTP